jgi:hypothetical protein
MPCDSQSAIRQHNALTALSEAELADRLRLACERYDALDKRCQASADFWTTARVAKYPRIYRFCVTTSGSPGFRLFCRAMVAIIVFCGSRGSTGGFAIPYPLSADGEGVAMDAQIDEISAVTKEIERRLIERRTVGSGG